MFEATSFLFHILSRPTSSERLPCSALSLASSAKFLQYHGSVDCEDSFNYLNLIGYIEKEDFQVYDKQFKFLAEDLLQQHIDEFLIRYFKNSNYSSKYLYKYIHIYKLPFMRNVFAPFTDMFCRFINFMYDEKISDGYMMISFLKCAYEYDSSSFRYYAGILEPDMLNFIMTNVVKYASERDPASHKVIQTILPVTIYMLPVCFDQLRILLQFGNEWFWSQEDLLYNIEFGWQIFFHQRFSLIQDEVMKLCSLRRLFLLLQLYAVFEEQDPLLKQDYLDPVKQLWRAVNDPFVTSVEIRDIFRIVPESKFSKVNEFGINFEEIFGVHLSRPRSLQHISRCLIRSCLNEKAMLPLGIQQLPLPERLKAYLRLEK